MRGWWALWACVASAGWSGVTVADASTTIVLTAAVERPEIGATGPDLAERQVLIHRDDWGVPHVHALTDADALYGAGYALAADNLESILRIYLALMGRSAAVFGPDAVEADLFNLQWGFLEQGRAGYGRLSAEEQALFASYVAGIERFMLEHPDRRPDWAPPLAPYLPVAAGHAVTTGISVRQGGQAYEDCAAGPVPLAGVGGLPVEPLEFVASNQWILMPWRTADGSLMFWADSHSPFGAQRDEIRIHGHRLATAGVVPAGMALPIIATTRHLAWAYAVGGPDTSDCYEIELSPDMGNQYRFDDELRTLEVRSVEIEVAGHPSVTRSFEYATVNGIRSPVIARTETHAYAAVTGYLDHGERFSRQIYGMNTARNISEFKQALAIQGLFPENVMVADANREAYYVLTGLTPRRPPGFDWTRPVPGNTSAAEWVGFHPLEDLVQIQNPPQGYMQNNNVATDTMMDGSPMTAERYPAYIFNDEPGRTHDRGERAVALLSRQYAATKSDFLAIAMDEFYVNAHLWLDALLEATRSRTAEVRAMSPAERELLHGVLNFDGEASRDSISVVQYIHWRHAIVGLAAGQGIDAPVLGDSIREGRANDAGAQALLVSAVGHAASRLVQQHGTVRVSLGEIFRVGRSGTALPLGGYGFSTGGHGERTLRSMQCSQGLWERGNCHADFGQRHPMLTIFGQTVQSWTAIPYGQNRDPASRHHSDQSRLASEGQLKPTYLHWKELEPRITETTVLWRD